MKVESLWLGVVVGVGVAGEGRQGPGQLGIGEVGVAIRRQDQQARRTKRPHDVLEQEQGGAVRPVQVVQDEGHGPAGGDVLDPSVEGLEQPEPLRLAARLEGFLEGADPLRHLREQPGDLTTAIPEVGSKDADVNIAPYLWVQWIREELAAGAWKVITEGREGGTAGIYRPTGEMRTGLIDEIAHEIEYEALIFEAPTKESQAWFVKQFGPNVNLGNIPPDEVIPLETLRLGLRGDTLKEILLGDAEPAPS